MSEQWFKCLLISAFTACLTPAYANEAVDLLNSMNDALHKLEYQGNLVYTKGGESSNLSIRHTIENGREKETVSLLDENGDEFVKESSAFSLSTLPKITAEMQKVYSFDLGGTKKVAGRPCRLVIARPKDKKRFLQKYCIDLDRTVVLKYSLINQRQIVESFMFTDFEILSGADMGNSGDEVPRAMGLGLALVEDKMQPDDANKAQFKTKMTNQSVGSDSYKEWFFDSLPAGFRIVSADKVSNPEGEDEQIIISDGLSSVSVFISADKNVTKPPVQPITSGALNILSKIHQGAAITLVGEVPKSTLLDIYKGMRKEEIQ